MTSYHPVSAPTGEIPKDNRLRPVYCYVAMAEQQPKKVVGQGLDRHANLRTPSMDVEGLIKDQSLALVACNVLLHQFEAWGTVSTLLAT